MPPTPFHPTHTTPFKSSISSSQQPRSAVRNGARSAHSAGAETEWPTQLKPEDLHVDDWTYLAEGGKHLLLRYVGEPRWPFVASDGRRIAVRLVKTARGKGSDVSTDHIDTLAWHSEIITPALAPSGDGAIEACLPSLQKIACDGTSQERGMQTFIALVSDRIEAQRPLSRRRVDGITAGSKILATNDLGFVPENQDVVVIEVKPKCGFLPRAETLSTSIAGAKTRHSRYRMHRIHKSGASAMTLDKFGSLYDPLDLYSGDIARVDKAAEALLREWTAGSPDFNNLRITVNGKNVDGSAAQSEADAVSRRLMPSTGGLRDLLSAVLKSEDTQQVLTSLVQAQARFDAIDIEGVEQVYQRARGKSLTDASDEPPITLDEYRLALESEATDDVRLVLARHLLSATFKDCSLFIRCTKASSPEAQMQTSVHLVDLDPKPVSKMPHYLTLDRDIVQNFKAWAVGKGIDV